METHDPLMVGMFWGGVLVASIPMLLAAGIAFFVIRHYLRQQRGEPSAETSEPP